jgi:2'-5' RNA ligase
MSSLLNIETWAVYCYLFYVHASCTQIVWDYNKESTLVIKLKKLIVETKYDFGCVMAQIPPNVSPLLIKFGQELITDDLLFFDPTGQEDFGREKEPHITIKFGLTQRYSQQQMSEFLKGAKPFSIMIQSLGIFETPRFDVVKFNVQGDEELLRLRGVFNALPNEDAHKEYHPHITVAYVKKGIGKRFENRSGRGFSRIPINLIKFSDKGNPMYFRL